MIKPAIRTKYWHVLRVALCVLVLGMLAGTLTAQTPTPEPWSSNKSPLPPPTGPVMDYAGVIDPATKTDIEKKIIAYRDKSTPKTELAVAVVKTTGERPIFDYSLAVARGWGIGSKESDNPGALLFIAIEDRKYFTQISKDLEDELPDGIAGSLQRQYLVPAFKAGNYGKGISDTIDAYIKQIEARRTQGPTPTPAATPVSGQTDPAITDWICRAICCIIVIVGIIFFILAVTKPNKWNGKSDKNRWRGGGFGGGTGSSTPVIVSTGSWWGGSSSDSGGSSSWGSSGGGDSWGGFGGGGDFGGGGAGGDW